MRIRLWELLGVGVGLVVALSYFATGQSVVGVGFGVASLLWLVSRSRPVQAAGVAAGHTVSEAQRQLLIVVGLSSALAVTVVLLIMAAFGGWAETRVGLVAVVALTGLEVSILVHLSRHLKLERRWREGADAELAVAASLEELEREGWFVHHNWPRPGGGNVDHVVAGPRGVFAIETKNGRYRNDAYSQALGAAMAVKRKADTRFVYAVVCVGNADAPYERRRHVHVVARDHLVDWLRGQPMELIPTDRIASALRG